MLSPRPDHAHRVSRLGVRARRIFKKGSIFRWETGKPSGWCLCLSPLSPPQEKSLVEIIVVDAGCKDDTMAAVASMKLDVKLRSVL